MMGRGHAGPGGCETPGGSETRPYEANPREVRYAAPSRRRP